jgi:predicted Zn-dependent peptidase
MVSHAQEATLHRILPALLAFAAAIPARAADPQIHFEKHVLGNGLTVILSEDHRLPQVAVDIWYHVGAANELPGRSGFAHLFEHMGFSGSRHVQPSSWKIFEDIGSRAGAMVNGTTNFDRTNFFEVVPGAELPTALWVEADRLGYLLDTLDEQKLKVQRDVVSNEKRQSYENRPYGMADLKICDVVFPKPHPYYGCVIGDIGEIQAASVDDVRNFFRKYYGPNNAILAVVGDFDPAQALELVKKYFADIPRGPDTRVPDIAQPQLGSVVKERFEDKLAELPRFVLVWNGVKQYAPEEAAGDVLAYILGTGKTSRLYRSLVVDKKIASTVSADDNTFALGGWIEIATTATKDHSVAEMQPAVQAVIDDVRRRGVTPAEVERAKANIIAAKVRSFERIGGFGGKADLLANYQTYLGDPGWFPKDLARYRAVTAADVKAFAEEHLVDERRLELDVAPARSAK